MRLEQEKAKIEAEKQERERAKKEEAEKQANLSNNSNLYKVKPKNNVKTTSQENQKSKPPRSDSSSSFLTKYDKIKTWTFAMLRDEINTSTDIELLDACRIEFDARLKQHHKWQERLALSQSVSGFTSYESYRENILNNVKQRYFKIIHDFDQGADKRLKGKTIFYFHFSGENCMHQVKATYLESDSSKPVLERYSRNSDSEKICQILLKNTGLVETYNAEISASEFAGMWSFQVNNNKLMLEKKEFVIQEF